MSRIPETLLPEGWPRPKGYAAGIRVPAGRDLVFVAGMVGWDLGERIVSADFVAQFEQALRNVLAVVESAGGTGKDIVRMTVFVTDLDAYRSRLPEIGVAWKRVMGSHFPSMALLQVAGLLEAGAMVEVEATAAVASKP